MLEVTKEYYPLVSLIFMLILILVGIACASELYCINENFIRVRQNITELLEESKKCLTAVEKIQREVETLTPLAQVSQYEIHAAAASFVPRLRKEADFAAEDRFKEDRDAGEDAENIYYERKREN